jgi:hypothetical protein
MPVSLSTPHHSAFGRRRPAALALAWHRARIALRAAFAEGLLYACGSQRSHLHGRAALRDLDARLRRDVGLTGTVPGKQPAGVEELR